MWLPVRFPIHHSIRCTPRPALVGVALCVLAACGGSTGSADAWVEQTQARLSLRSQVAQLLVADLGEAGSSLVEGDSISDELREWLVRDSVGGVMVRGGEAADVARLLNQLQQNSQVPLLVTSTVDCGLGGTVNGATEFPSLAAMAGRVDADDLREVGRLAAAEARSLGIHLALVRAAEPTGLLPDAASHAEAGTVAFLQGLAEGGMLTAFSVLVTPEGADTARAPPFLPWDLAWLEARELPLLRQSVRGGVDAVVLESVALPSLSGDTLPLPFSSAVASGLLRRDLEFGGLVIADLAASGTLPQAADPADAAVAALAAGADLLLGVGRIPETIDAVVAAVVAGRLPRGRVEEAGRRVLRAKAAAGLDRTTTQRRQQLQGRGAVQLAQRLFELIPPPAATEASSRKLVLGPAAQAGMNEAGLARADAILRRAVADSLFPGAALAVGRRGVLVRLRGYGLQSREPDAPAVDPERTLYDLASLTKVLGPTAAAMALVDDGVIELDAPASRYMSAFSGGDRERVTVRQLLSHTGGLPVGLALHGNAASPQEALGRIIGARLVLDPGSVALYSDLSMIVLGEAVAHATGEPLDRLLARRVFRPLGMGSTQFLPPLALRPYIAPSAQTAPDEWDMQGIVHDGTAFRLGGIAGHAGIFSTALDVAIFAQTMLNGGSYGAQRVFSPQTVETFRARQPRAQERALGWDTPAPESSAGSFFSERSFGHTGFTGTSLWIDPDKDLFVVLLTNRTYDRSSLLRMLELRQRVHDAIARSITDQPVTRRPGAIDVIPPPRPQPVRRPPARRVRR